MKKLLVAVSVSTMAIALSARAESSAQEVIRFSNLGFHGVTGKGEPTRVFWGPKNFTKKAKRCSTCTEELVETKIMNYKESTRCFLDRKEQVTKAIAWGKEGCTKAGFSNMRLVVDPCSLEDKDSQEGGGITLKINIEKMNLALTSPRARVELICYSDASENNRGTAGIGTGNEDDSKGNGHEKDGK